MFRGDDVLIYPPQSLLGHARQSPWEAGLTPAEKAIVSRFPTSLRVQVIDFNRKWEALCAEQAEKEKAKNSSKKLKGKSKNKSEIKVKDISFLNNPFTEYVDSIMRVDCENFLSSSSSLESDLIPEYKHRDFFIDDAFFKQFKNTPEEVRRILGENFWTFSGSKFDSLCGKNNAFALYFKAVFLDYFKFLSSTPILSQEEIQPFTEQLLPQDLEQGQADQNRIRNVTSLLEKASEQNYVRATSYIIEHRYFIKSSEEDLIKRILPVTEPDQYIKNYIHSHMATESSQFADIYTLKETLLECLPGNRKVYDEIYLNWCEKLRDKLLKNKAKETDSKAFVLTMAQSTTASILNVGQGVLGLYIGITTNMPTTDINSVLQLLAGGTLFVTSLGNHPYTSNMLKKIISYFPLHSYFYPEKPSLVKNRKLLPTLLDDKEISIQAHLIALYGLVCNHPKILKDTVTIQQAVDLPWTDAYLKTLKKLTLNSYTGQLRALGQVILKEEKDKFEYQN